jgi:hypothetical protein
MGLFITFEVKILNYFLIKFLSIDYSLSHSRQNSQN